MFERMSNPEMGSEGMNNEVEDFVKKQEELLKARLEITPLNEDKIDKVQEESGEREIPGV